MSPELLQESETVELKKSLAELKEGLISMAAILNKHGEGELWFGVAPSGKPVELEVTDKTLRDLSQAVGVHIEPRIYPHIQARDMAGKTCIHVRFEGRDAPYFAYGRAYMRVADEDRQLSAQELQNLILNSHRDALRWDKLPSGLELRDLDEAKIRRFVERSGLTWDTSLNALAKLDLLDHGEPVNAARLFFSSQPIQLRCAVFASTDTVTIIDRHDFDGDMLDLIEEAQKYILKNIHIGMRIEGLYRVDVPEISTEALREAVINAFCHRDWRDPDYVQVAIFKDRVEIRNPGQLYGGLTIEDLRRGNVSRRRNPLIADLFRRIEMVEAWGRGMPLILQKAPSVQFREVAGLFIASFGRPSFVTAGMSSIPEPQENHQKTPRKPPENAKERLLAVLQAQPSLSVAAIAKELGSTPASVRHHLRVLQAAGRVRRIGPDKGGRWEVLEPDDQDEAGRIGSKG